MTQPNEWSPGCRVRIDNDQDGVFTRSLLVTDLEGDLESWMGSEQRTKNVWKPPIPPRDYMRGLIGACDQKRTFVFGTFLAKDAAGKLAGTLVGYRKVQLVREPEGLALIPTAVIGDSRLEGRGLAVQAGDQIDWFLGQKLGVQWSAPRIYEENARVVTYARHLGFKEVRSSLEAGPDGKQRKVYTFLRSIQERLQKLGDKALSYRLTVI